MIFSRKKTEAQKKAIQSKEKDKEVKESPKAVPAKPGDIQKTIATHADRIILFPLITEKSGRMAAFNQYAFAVDPRATKVQVKGAVKALYGVLPQTVNMVTMRGKKVRYGRTQGRTKHWKKAIVRISEGQKIELQKGV